MMSGLSQTVAILSGLRKSLKWGSVRNLGQNYEKHSYRQKVWTQLCSQKHPQMFSNHIHSVCVCVRAHEGESHSCVPVLMKKYVCVGCLQEKKNMAVLPELHIKQHTIERHSLYLFLSQNINEERGQSTNKTHLEDSLHVLKKYQNLLEVRSQRNPRKRLSLACDLPTCIKMSAC